jgi:hypothetical protein
LSKAVIVGLAAALAIVSGIALYYASLERAGTETRALGNDENQAATESAQFLFVQHASSGSLVKDGDSYMLALNGVSESTIRFADRPYRYVDSISTGSFVEQWSLGNDSFKDDPPNAALVLNESDGRQKTVIVELLNPIFDEEMQSLTYEVVAVGESDEFTVFEHDGSVDREGDVTMEFGQATLVIDNDTDEGFSVPHSYCIATGADIECSCDLHYVQVPDRAACVEDTSS